MNSTAAWNTTKGHGFTDGQQVLLYGWNGNAPEEQPQVATIHTGRRVTFTDATGKKVMAFGAATKYWAAPAPVEEETPKKATAGARGVPTEAAHKDRQAYLAEVGMDTYRKQYNGGWDAATYGQGAKKAESGTASVAWMDGYTDRIANPGKEGIAAKWSALRSKKAPVTQVKATAKA